ncbi:hypothetical protein REPUB_Repub02eG0198100 [Reevesia pubescens]
MFLFHFSNPTDKDRVFFLQPWAFNRSLVALREFDGLSFVGSVNMEFCLFWVQIHILLIGMMNEKVALVVANSLGDMEEVDVKDGSLAWGWFLWVRGRSRRPWGGSKSGFTMKETNVAYGGGSLYDSIGRSQSNVPFVGYTSHHVEARQKMIMDVELVKNNENKGTFMEEKYHRIDLSDNKRMWRLTTQ